MFPHQKLDWNVARLEKRLESAPDDAVARTELARACLSRGLFHDGGEPWLNKALTQGRRVLQGDPDTADALVAAGMALVAMDRLDAAQKYIDRAVQVAHERADVHLAAGQLARAQGSTASALRSFEFACRLAPDAFEPHLELSQLLWSLAEGPNGSLRLVERSAFHAVRALRIGVTTQLEAGLWFHIAQTCLLAGRLADAHRLLTRLVDNEKYKAKALASLGTVDHRLGKYKNAVQHLRRHIELVGDSHRAYARMAASYLSLGEIQKSREAALKALTLSPGDEDARFTLASALVEEGREDDAVRELKSLLQEAPDHAPAFAELVRLRVRSRDLRWIRNAMRSEAGVHDRLPAEGRHEGRATWPRRATRERIVALILAVREVDDQSVKTLLSAMELTTDEGLRFQLWEAAIDTLSAARAAVARGVLQQPGSAYSAAMGREIIALAPLLEDEIIQKGLYIEDADLGKAAVERHGPARDVRAHRAALDRERREARAWQALLLLALGIRQQPTTRTLLLRWTTEADPDLADAARVALAMLGDAEATLALRRKARARGVDHLVDAMTAGLTPTAGRIRPRVLTDAPEQLCAVCGRRTPEIGHLVTGPTTAVCDRCLAALAAERRELAEAADAGCRLCTATPIDTRAVWQWRGTEICSDCLDTSLGLVERDEISAFLATC